MTTIQIQGNIPPAQYRMAVRVLKVGLKLFPKQKKSPVN